jgi:hypothetical protein
MDNQDSYGCGRCSQGGELFIIAGNAGDVPEGRELLKQTTLSAKYVVMDRAYEGDETR